ncbi:cation channel family protein (macronuclear) [Tetrahymena thermophila SB210]|uniref:Cation channel family protein n=1 Tax=Tetrahymena thermophila (strain SB210) TaxID=312017 RepID=W7XFW6_TETTS|nr:cation channel family protein [Tetrahymena thermophila SB210]EWS72926.1 cation channel family protein [Tetrahymena thermophila SB210]|eukprot:XP_012654540.1 cation channel family protein [Tetrahymena thermophila SB210]
MNLQLQSKLQAYYDLLKLVFYIIILIHIFGCGFYFVGVYSSESFDERNWIKTQNLVQSSKIEQYINSIYFITITMVTIGYGDIYPINQYEKLYTIIVAFITCGFFAFSLNLIGEIAQNIQKKSMQLQQKQQIIQSYLNSRQIENVSQMRVLKYLEFLNGSQEETNIEGQRILQTCSKSIREDILREYYGKILSKCQIIKDNFSQELINRLSLKMKEKSFAPGETIIEKGSYLQELYFIKSGKIEYFFKTQNENKYISDNENQIVDFKIFISQSESDIQVRSQGITTVIYIEYNQFIETFEHLKNDKEKLCQIKDQFIYGQSYQYPCQSCGQYKHTIFNCPQVTFRINKSQLLKRYNHSQFQQRDEYFDRFKYSSKNKKFKTFQQNYQVKMDLKLIRCDLVNYFYNLKQDSIASQQLILKIQNDKEFYQTLPKIYQYWFNQKDENENDNKDNFQDKQIFNSQLGLFYEQNNNQYTSSSLSSCSSDYSDTLKQLTQVSKTNQERCPSISKQESIQTSVIFGNENQKSIPHSKADLEAEPQSCHQVPSDNKIAIPNLNRHHNNCSMIEDSLSPSSQKQIPIDSQNEQNGVDQLKQQISNKVKFNIQRRETRNKTKKVTTLIVNTQPDQRQQSRTSLNSKNYKEPNSPVDEHHKDSIMNTNAISGHNTSNIQVIQQKGMHRVSLVQYQLQEQINMLQDLLRSQKRNSSRGFTQNNSTLSKLKSIKYQQDIKGLYINPNSHQNINFNNKHHSRLKNLSFQDNATFFEQDYIFGKCGKEFEIVKELEFYFPKFNFTQVIKSYKKFLSFQKRQKNQQEDYGLLKSVKKNMSMKPKTQFFKAV